MLPVLRTEQAAEDVAEILHYLEERSPAAADRVAAALDQRCGLLGQVPLMGRARGKIRPGLRSLAVGQYVVFYRVTLSAVEILRVLHGSRNVEQIMKQNEDSD